MATNLDDDTVRDPNGIKELIHQLKIALEQCHKLLGEAERSVAESKQDNDPPK